MIFVADPPPFIDGVRINSPHYLCKILQSKAGTHRYTLVVSQYEKCNTINYSLRVFSTCPFELKKIVMPYKYKEEVYIFIHLEDFLIQLLDSQIYDN